MNNALRKTLTVEVRELFKQVMVVISKRATLPYRNTVVIICDWRAT
jgi:hypothetical protein